MDYKMQEDPKSDEKPSLVLETKEHTEVHLNTTVSGSGIKEVVGSQNDEDSSWMERKTKPEVFKKPVFLIGPRKGKSIGRIQVLKSIGSDNQVTVTSKPADTNKPLVSDVRNLADTEEVPEGIKTLPAETEKLPEDTNETDDEKNLPAEKVENLDDAESSSIKIEPVKADSTEKNILKVSPAQTLNENTVPLPYKEPKWSGIPNDTYKFEVLKNGSILDTIDVSCKPYFVFGRLTTCDVHMAHPTISRHHAVLQFRSDNTEGSVGFYIYDLGSTHGTFLNKYRIKSNMYVRVRVGHLLKFGGSTRMFILQGPEEDMEKESNLTVTELKEKRKEEQTAKELQELQEIEELRLQQEKEEAQGIDWGMGDDADEETDLSENPFAAAPNEELYLNDPKKTLRGWFEREGYDLEYDVEEKGYGQFLCRVELPVESAKGGTIVAESLVKGKKKEAVVQCALEACRVLDRYGLLRQAKRESRKRKVKNWEENDYYDSDEDEFLDRTGTVEKKRQQRMKAAGKIETQTETYESLVKKHEDIMSQINEMQKQLDSILTKSEETEKLDEEEDALDAFMTNLSKEVPDSKLISKLKSQLVNLRKEEAHVRKLVNITCPASLPKLEEEKSTHSTAKLKHPHIMQKKIHHSSKKEVNIELSEKICENAEDDVEEMEEEHEGDNSVMDVQNGKECPPSSESNDSKEASSNCLEDGDSLNSLGTVLDPDKQSDKTENEKNVDKNSVSSKKVMGPSLPTDEFTSEGQKEKRKKRVRQRPNKKTGKDTDSNYSSDPNYSMWVPPAGQSGDGKTKLNEKYGY